MLKQTSEELFFKALEIALQEKTADAISVRDILDISGLSRQTFYKKFSDKYDLINQYFYKIFEETYQKIGGDYMSLHDFFLHKYTILQNYQNLFRAASQSKDFNNLLQFTRIESCKFFIKRYEQKVGLCSQNEKELLEFYCYGMTYFIEKYVQNPQKYSPAVMAKILSDAMPIGLSGFFKQLFHQAP